MQKSKTEKNILRKSEGKQESATPLSVALLKNVFFKKQDKNPSYSLRAFAKYLGVSHTALSLIFSGKRPLNSKFANQIIDKLDLTFQQRKLFFAEHSHADNSTHQLKENFNEINIDKFAFISEWQHYAILSLLETEDFKMDFDWIAKRLGISELLAKNSIQRLIRLGLIKKDSKGKWAQQGGYIRLNNKHSTAATKHFHKQLIKKGYESLSNDPFEIRDHSSITFAMNPKDIPYAVNQIKEFRYKLCKELEEMNTKKEVYNLCVQLYPVSRRKK